LGVFQWKDSKRDAHPSQRREPSKQSIRELGDASNIRASAWAHDSRTSRLGKEEHNCSCSPNGKVLAQISSGKRVALRTCGASSCLNSDDNQTLSVLREGVPDKKTHGLESQVLSSKLQNVRSPKKVKSISQSKATEDVYCLNVPRTSNFVLANGIISHNCDALRYLCKERLIDSKWEQPAEVFNNGLIRIQAYIQQMRANRGKPTI
jgi:hypothetical protein